MRILTVGNMYPPHHLGGYELMWRSSVRDLRARGHEVRVLTTDYRSKKSDPAIEEDPDVHRELRWYWRDHAWPRLSFLERRRLELHNLSALDRHLESLQPEVVAWWAMGGMSLSMIERVLERKLPGAAVVVDDWLLYAPKEDQWQRLASRLGPLRRLAGPLLGIPSRLRFDEQLEWVFVSRVVSRHARDAGWKLPRAVIAHAGVESELFTPSPPRPWGGELAYVGRLDPRKGIHIAIAAVAEIPGVMLSVVGGGDDLYRRELEELVAKLGVEEQVRFEARPRRQLPSSYAEVDAIVFPVQWEEPFGLVPLEAMATGRPVIASGTGGSAEYLTDGTNCLIYSPRDDPSALAATIRKLAADEDLRDRLRKGGAETAARLDESNFNREVELALMRAVRG